MHCGVGMGKWIRWVTVTMMVALPLALPAISWAQKCSGGLISGCPAAVNPQASDLAWVWQNNQSPHTRAATFGQVVQGGLSIPLTVKVTAMPSAAAGAGVNIGVGASPSSCIAGDIWQTDAGLFSCPSAGVAVGPIAPVTSVNPPVYANAGLLPAVTAGNNGNFAFVQNCANGSESGGSITGCLYIVNNAGIWTAHPDPSSLTVTVGGQAVYLGGATTNQGNGSKLQLASGLFTVGHALAYDNNGNAVDSGVPPSGGSGGSGTVTASPQNAIPFYSSAGSSAVISGLTITNNAVLATSSAGVPAEVTTLPGGLTIPSAILSSPSLTGTISIAAATYTGKQTYQASTAGTASLNIPPGVAPTSPTNGDIWETTSGVLARVNGATQGPLVASIVSSAPLAGGAVGPTVTLTCTTCATTTSGGPLSAAAPVTISGAGLIGLGAQPMLIPWIADNATTVHNDTYNLIEKWTWVNSGTINSFVYHTGGTSTPSFVISLQINGTPVTGCNTISVTSTTDSTATCTAANTITNGQTMSMVITGTSGSPSSAVVQINASRPAS